MVEIIVSVGLIFTAVAALLALVVISLRGSGFGTTKARATKLSHEQMERVRSYRDTYGWDVFYDDLTEACVASSCYIDDNLILQSTVYDGEEPFECSFQVEDIDGNRLRVAVEVTWGDRGEERRVPTNAILTNWR